MNRLPRVTDLGALPASDRERAVANKYTRIGHREDGDGQSIYWLTLVVGSQQFDVGWLIQSASEATWLAWQLAQALIQIADETDKEVS